jgi:hypothetical protein
MQIKSLVVILVVSVLLASFVFGAYQFGSINGYNLGYEQGRLSGITPGLFTRGTLQHSYDQGYYDGLNDRNQTMP